MSNVEGKGLDDLAQELKNFSQAEIMQATQAAAKKTADDAVRKLKATSPKSKGHTRYASKWKAKKEDDGYIVYNEQPGLTHLLENGHDIVRHGAKVGRAKARPHIAPVEKAAANEFVNNVMQELQRRLGG
jgi:hypothetical protein